MKQIESGFIDKDQTVQMHDDIKERLSEVINAATDILGSTEPNSSYTRRMHLRHFTFGDNKQIPLRGDVANFNIAETKDRNEQQTTSFTEVCPETFRGTTFGYPFFNTGWEIVNCNHSKPLKELVSIAINREDHQSTNSLIDLLKGINRTHPGIPIVMHDRQSTDISEMKGMNIKKINSAAMGSPGSIWNELVNATTTPYILIARGLLHFDNDTRLERLIRELNLLKVSTIGGAVKQPDGVWGLGCVQAARRNYTLVYRSGYHKSEHECLFCSYIVGPFLARTSYLKENSFDKMITNTEVMFRDFFIPRNPQNIAAQAVCPDSMFSVDHQRKPNKEEWLSSARKHETLKISMETGQVHRYSCSEVPMASYSQLGMARSACNLQGLSDIIKFTLRACRSAGLFCEPVDGTLLSAVKLHKPFPWERDADLVFLTQNFSALFNLSNSSVMLGMALLLDLNHGAV